MALSRRDRSLQTDSLDFGREVRPILANIASSVMAPIRTLAKRGCGWTSRKRRWPTWVATRRLFPVSPKHERIDRARHQRRRRFADAPGRIGSALSETEIQVLRRLDRSGRSIRDTLGIRAADLLADSRCRFARAGVAGRSIDSWFGRASNQPWLASPRARNGPRAFDSAAVPRPDWNHTDAGRSRSICRRPSIRGLAKT